MITIRPAARARKSAHPFYCTRKGCRKNLTDTPEYLSDADWALARALVAALETVDRKSFDALLDSRGNDHANAYAFFYRICGWPEGLRYYVDGSDVVRDSWFRNFIARDLPGWKRAIQEHDAMAA